MRNWKLQDAKAQFSKVVQEASQHGPQEITLRGKPVVVILSKLEYNRLVKLKPTLVTFLQQSPLKGIDIDLTRDKSFTRDDEL